MLRENRKLDHVRLALSSATVTDSDFDDLKFVHRSLPETNCDGCRLNTDIGGLSLSSPVFINAMTGGSAFTKEINTGLAEAARETGVPLAVGSQRAALANPELADTYRIVRKVNPNGIVIANLGAGASVDEANRAIDMIEADMLQLHLNVPQELVMPEGDRNFKGILEMIQRVKEEVGVPVIVKETGFGMSGETYTQLRNAGISIVDVGGCGGTNFIEIENRRRRLQEYSHLSPWGQSTVVSLLEAQEFEELQTIASGGIRNSLDMVKCFALGAKAAGLAGPILRLLSEQGVKGVIDAIRSWHEQLRTVITMLGCVSIDQLTSVPLVVTGKTKDWCEARGIDYYRIARRKWPDPI